MGGEIKVKARWSRNLQFIGTDDRGHAVVLDGLPPEEGGMGEGTGFRPGSLLITALVACTGMDVISILKKKRQRVTGLEVFGSGELPDEYPKEFETIHVEYVVRGYDVDPRAVARAIELSEGKYCVVGHTLQPKVKIVSTYRIEEEESPD